ncbi:MAG: hypothetical protein KIG72_09365 [Bradymonadales bacterium]|nr:hypothetical protein [Bradymonadales bacterium]
MNIMEYMFDQDNITRLYGIEQMNIGRREGREEGKKEEKKATASNLLALNMDIPFIEKVTGLSQVEILKLKEH